MVIVILAFHPSFVFLSISAGLSFLDLLSKLFAISPPSSLNLGKETTADYRTRLLNRDVLSRCETVPMFDKQPGLVGFAAKSSGPHQDPRTVQLFAMQRKFEVSLLERSYDVVALRDPCSTVPDHDGSTPVLHLHNSKSHPPFFAAAASLLPSAYN
jgi:hypothetical protein